MALKMKLFKSPKKKSGFISKNSYTLGLSNATDLPYIRILYIVLNQIWFNILNFIEFCNK
ncbi:hypothetical protein BpHYR1_016523 [Brachionus plicatilis]|uniref:Uncharacterized protein n=1 Tax=Brachionus plicatilis TaxID=10195 RepID=A0A3M7R8B3_BRAPC|nr:hypothetical protein BpHYR1_016523 [Brachionus plicatilis]